MRKVFGIFFILLIATVAFVACNMLEKESKEESGQQKQADAPVAVNNPAQSTDISGYWERVVPSNGSDKPFLLYFDGYGAGERILLNEQGTGYTDGARVSFTYKYNYPNLEIKDDIFKVNEISSERLVIQSREGSMAFKRYTPASNR